MRHTYFTIEPGMIGCLDGNLYVVIATWQDECDGYVRTYELWDSSLDDNRMTDSCEIIS